MEEYNQQELKKLLKKLMKKEIFFSKNLEQKQ
jgi:hypothetical protein